MYSNKNVYEMLLANMKTIFLRLEENYKCTFNTICNEK